MAISLCIKGREEMTEKIIIKPSVQKRFDSFMVHGRVLFFSAPCGFGKTVLADALLRGRNVLRQSAAAPDWAIPSSAQDWDILLIDDLQLMQEEAGQQALCELIRSSPERHFVLLSRGAPLGCLMAFQYQKRDEAWREALTAAEMQVLRLICADKSNAEIGEILNIRVSTVKSHVSSVLSKLGVNRRSEARTAAKKLWLISEDQ